MKHPNNFRKTPYDGLIFDFFAGGGGTSTGVYMALGRHVDYAINHDPNALIMHRVNHPHTHHLCEDVFEADPDELCQGCRVDLATFSPDCTHFSKARGGKPVEKRIRGLSWVVVKWAATVRPRVIIMENVEEITTWGPLKNGQPDPKYVGRTWKAFIACLTHGLPANHPDMAEVRKAIGPDIPVERLIAGLGYQVEWKELSAYEYGAPTTRKRLKLIARCDNKPIVWPLPSHGKPDDPMVKAGLKKLWRMAWECIDFSIPIPSIFTRGKHLADNSLKRIARGLWKFVLACAKPFIIRTDMSQSNAGCAYSVDEPVRTSTSTGGFAVVSPMIQHIQHGSAVTGCMPPDGPMNTITAHPKGGGMAVTAAHLLKIRSGSIGTPMDVPVDTITAGGHQARPGTGNAMGIMSVNMIKVNHTYEQFRGQEMETPMPTMTGKSGNALVAASLIKHYTDQGQSPGSDLQVPIGTVTAVDHHSLMSANLVRQFGNGKANSAEAPVGTVMTDGGGKTVLIQSELAPAGNHEKAVMHLLQKWLPEGTIDPTWLGRDKATAGFAVKYYRDGGQDQSLEDPMHTLSTKARMGLVTVAGQDYKIVDIFMRMLTPRELYNAQGFPRSYIINPMIPDAKATKKAGKPMFKEMPKYMQVRMVGNSVCPDVMEAIVRVNLPELIVWREGERRMLA